MTLTLSRKIDALDNWCLRRILNIHWSEFVTNDEIRSTALGSHFYPTLFAAAVCHSLDIFIVLTLGRIITELFRPALWTLLVIGDGGLVAPDNPGSESWSLTCSQ